MTTIRIKNEPPLTMLALKDAIQELVLNNDCYNYVGLPPFVLVASKHQFSLATALVDEVSYYKGKDFTASKIIKLALRLHEGEVCEWAVEMPTHGVRMASTGVGC